MPDLRDRLQAALGAGYRVVEELGGGGMSRVFLAEEVRLGRRVVIKVLPPEMAAGVSVDRFEREIQLAAQLQHPHIVPLLSAGSSDELLYYIMPYITGESLRAKLTREGELPVPDVLGILHDVLEALAYAHRQGVVHRDIKPDNVLLSEGHALVTDFGVAKAVAASTGTESLTSVGVALGTPLYMAPEQAAANPQIDHRADLYAVGVLTYELLCGRPPFAGPTPQAVLAAQVTEAPVPCSTHRPAVPAALNALVLRLLEKHPADRWQQAEDVRTQVIALATSTVASTPAGTTPTISAGTQAVLDRTRPVRVAVLYGLAAIGVLALVGGAVQLLGLPYWVLYAAMALLVVGLPIMLATGRQERRRALARSTGRLTATPAHGLERFFTWHRALWGGGLAFAGLGIVTTLLMVLRLLGVGPFATLLSAGVLKQRDLLVLADFANHTTDSTLGLAITEALRIDLTRSPVVRLVEGNEVAATLRRMRRDPTARLDEAAAREVALRDGAKAVVAGEVTPLGGGYVLAARVVNATDSTTLLAVRETAADAAGLIPAVGRLSRKLRAGVGESLRDVRGEPPLPEVTTSSLAALRAYSEGNRLWNEGRWGDALAPLRQAVALDSTFGLAWLGIASSLGDAEADRARMLVAGRKAYQLRDRMPPREAGFALARHYMLVGDVDQAKSTFEGMLARWPDDARLETDLAIGLLHAGRPADAEQLGRRVFVADPASVTTNILLEALVDQGKDTTADSVMAVLAKVAPQSSWRLSVSAALAREESRYGQALVSADSLARTEQRDGRPIANGLGFGAQDATLRFLGRLREARAASERTLALIERRGTLLTTYVPFVIHDALGEAVLLGRPDSAVRRVEAALQRHPLDSVLPASRPYGELIYFYAMAGRLDKAQALAAEYHRLVSPEDQQGDAWGQRGLARLALARGDARAALARLRRAPPILLACRFCTGFDEAQAFEQLGEPDSALAAYERFATQGSLFPQMRDVYLAPALRRLGELYEAKGDRAKALEYYGRFVEQWKDADPELQPLVREVKQHMARLAGEPK